MRAGDGVAVKECEKLSEGVKERPVGEQADALVGVDGALARCCRRAAGRRASAGLRVGKAQLGTLLAAQALHREALIELDGSAIDLDGPRPKIPANQLTGSSLIQHCHRISSLVSGNKGATFSYRAELSGAKTKLSAF